MFKLSPKLYPLLFFFLASFSFFTLITLVSAQEKSNNKMIVEKPNLVGKVVIQKPRITEIIITSTPPPRERVQELEESEITMFLDQEITETDFEEELPQDELLEEELKKTEPVAGIRAFTETKIEFPSYEEEMEYYAATPNTLEITHGPVNLDIKSTFFISRDSLWELGMTPGRDIAKWDFSKDAVEWETFTEPDIAKVFDTNVPLGSTHNFYFRLNTPKKISSPGSYGARVIVIVSEYSSPEL